MRGARGSADTDYNANGWIDPEDLIFSFSDGVDDDGNGYKDDFVGWDTYEDDNDPFDEVQYGHGTGEARDSTAEVNNGGDAGVCPNCIVMHMRVGDSFVADVNDFAQGAVYATDNGASVIQSALGTLNNSRFAQEAINYAYRRGVVLIASAADESAGHHNQPSVLEHGVTFNAVGEPQFPSDTAVAHTSTSAAARTTAPTSPPRCPPTRAPQRRRDAPLAWPASSTRRHATASLRARFDDYGALDGAGGVTPGRGVSAEEVDQIIASTADDMNFLTPIDYTAAPGLPRADRALPCRRGLGPVLRLRPRQRRPHGAAVAQDKIPPEADITSPKWFETVSPDGGLIEIRAAWLPCAAPATPTTCAGAPGPGARPTAAPAYTAQWGHARVIRRRRSPTAGRRPRDDRPGCRDGGADAVNGPLGAVERPGVDPATGGATTRTASSPTSSGSSSSVRVTSLDAGGAPLTDIDGEALTGVGTKNFNVHTTTRLSSPVSRWILKATAPRRRGSPTSTTTARTS